MAGRVRRFLDKLFPPPDPGGERIIPSRHPVQVGLLLGFVAAAGFQYAAGPTTGSLGAAINWNLWVTMLLASVVGCLLCLTAAFLAERKPWDAMGFSLGGFFILTFVLMFSVAGYMIGYPYEFLAKREFWVNLFVGLGFLARFLQLAMNSIRIWRHR